MTFMKKMWIGVMVAGLGSGCSTYQMSQSCDDVCMEVRLHCEAKKAFMECYHLYADVPHPLHFEHGFIDGYKDVASGGNGCVPMMPPQKYWKSCYHTEWGQGAIRAWFDGFAHGALAAQQCGCANWSKVQISQPYIPTLLPHHAEHNIYSDGSTWGTSTSGGVPPAPASDEAPVSIKLPDAPADFDLNLSVPAATSPISTSPAPTRNFGTSLFVPPPAPASEAGLEPKKLNTSPEGSSLQFVE